MVHPFAGMFKKALTKSSSEDNFVLAEAEKLRKKGYSVVEIYDVLTKLQHTLIREADLEVVSEAVEEFSKYLEE